MLKLKLNQSFEVMIVEISTYYGLSGDLITVVAVNLDKW